MSLCQKKIVFIGAGSLVFTRNLVRDILTFESFRDAEICLVDINPTNLALSKKQWKKLSLQESIPQP